MARKAFSKADVEEAYFGGGNGVLENVHEGEFEQDGKMQSQEVIFRERATGKFYQYWGSRSGSPFTDWYYSIEDEPNEIELVEVAKATKTIEYWKAV